MASYRRYSSRHRKGLTGGPRSVCFGKCHGSAAISALTLLYEAIAVPATRQLQGRCPWIIQEAARARFHRDDQNDASRELRDCDNGTLRTLLQLPQAGGFQNRR